MPGTSYPFNMDTVKTIDTVFDIKEISSNETGDTETVFVPKEEISPEAKADGLAALRSLMAHKNPDIVENSNKTGVEQASNDSFAEFYRGTDMGRAEVAADIANMIADTKNTADILKAYSYNITDDNNIVFVPHDNQDTTRAKEILNAMFDMVPVQLGDYTEGLAPVAGGQARVIEFMTGKPSQEPQTEQALEQAIETGDIEALAKQLNDSFFLFGTLLEAKKGITGEQIQEAQEKLNPYFQTALVKAGERIRGLKPVSGEEAKAKVMYQIMHAVKNVQSIETLYPELLKNKDVQAVVQEIVSTEPVAENEATLADIKESSDDRAIEAAPVETVAPTITPTAVNANQEDTVSTLAMGLKEGPLPTPTGIIPDEVDENEGVKTFTDYIAEYMASAGDDTTRTSDENEVFFDAMRYAALNQSGEKFSDLLNLKAGERSEALDRVIGDLGDKNLKEYMGHLETVKMAALEALPPKKLAMLSDVVGKKLSKAKEGSDEHKALQTQLTNIDTRIDTIITDYVGGEIVIDDDNVADAYEGMMAILSTRDTQNETIQTAHEMLRVTINEYDDNNNLMGLTPKDDNALSARFDTLVGKMPIGDFDIKKLGGMLKGAPIAKDIATALTAIQFTNDKDDILPQTNDKGEIIVGTELDLLRQISIADAVTALVTEKGDLTPETVTHAFNDAVKNNIANLLIANLTEKGINPTREAVTKTFANLMQGQPHKVSRNVMTGFVAGRNNGHMGFVNRLATKVGKDSSIAKKLFAPIKGIDALAEKRFGPMYVKAKGLAKVLGGNITRAVLMGAASRIALIAGGPALAVGVSAAMTAVRYWKLRRAEVKSAKAQDKQIPSFGNFLKRNATGMAMSTVSMTAMAFGLPIVNMAVAGTNISRSVLSTFKQSRKGNFTRLQSLRRALMGTIPTAAAMATMALGGEYMNTAAQSTVGMAQDVTNMFTDTLDHLPTPTPITISEQDFANNVINGTPIPGVPQETVPNAELIQDTPTPPVNEVKLTLNLLDEAQPNQGVNLNFTPVEDVQSAPEGQITTPISTPMQEINTAPTQSTPVPEATTYPINNGLFNRPTPIPEAAHDIGTDRSFFISTEDVGVLPPKPDDSMPMTESVDDVINYVKNMDSLNMPISTPIAEETVKYMDVESLKPSDPLPPYSTLNKQDIPVISTDIQTGAMGADVVGETPLVHHAYSQEAHDLAHARLHSEGVYNATGHHAVHQNFNDAQLNQALSTVKEVSFGHAELQGPNGQSNAEILLYKLVQVDKLTGSNMDLQNGHEVGEHFGIKDSSGQLHTPHTLLNDLMNGKQVDAEIAAQILGKVENGVSAQGHFLEDIKNFNEAKTTSYRPDGNPGWAEAHDTPTPVAPAPVAPAPVVSQEPAPTPVTPAQTTEDSDYNPFEDPTIAIQPDQPEAPTTAALPDPANVSSIDNMLYFIPTDKQWKAPMLQDRIGALPKKKPIEVQKTDEIATPRAEAKVDKSPVVAVNKDKTENQPIGNVASVKKPAVDVSFNGQKAGTNAAFTFKMSDKAPDQKSAVEMVDKLRMRGTDGVKTENPKEMTQKNINLVLIKELHRMAKEGENMPATPMSAKQAHAINNATVKGDISKTLAEKMAPENPKEAEKVDPTIIAHFHNHKNGNR